MTEVLNGWFWLVWSLGPVYLLNKCLRHNQVLSIQGFPWSPLRVNMLELSRVWWEVGEQRTIYRIWRGRKS